MAIPAAPKLYHITHVDNLPTILAAGELRSDALMGAAGGPAVSIGMPHLKARRMGMPISCHPGDHVGDYVPFYLCPRSVMLFMIHKANHDQLAYRGGQGEIVHLELDLHAVAAHAQAGGGRIAFTRGNASAFYVEFMADLALLDTVPWDLVGRADFRDPAVKEAKQSEFLVHGSVPWSLVQRVGAQSVAVAERVERLLAGIAHLPIIEVRRDWYY